MHKCASSCSSDSCEFNHGQFLGWPIEGNEADHTPRSSRPARALAQTSCATLAVVHEAMFPLNDQPNGLPALLGHFENGEAIYHFIREHLRCGALVALSFMRAHYLKVNMNLVKMLPPTPSGRVEMDVYYVACKQATDCIMRVCNMCLCLINAFMMCVDVLSSIEDV
jgi:hypothetical protein